MKLHTINKVLVDKNQKSNLDFLNDDKINAAEIRTSRELLKSTRKLTAG